MKPNLWRRTQAGKFLRHLPRLKQMRGSWLHRRLGDRLLDSTLWQPQRETVARGLAIGFFFSMLPIPMQMFPASIVAVVTRSNVPAALVGCWITNPVTIPLFLVIQIQIGYYLLGRGSGWKNLLEHGPWELLMNAPAPLILGAIVLGCLTAVIGYFCGLGAYDWIINLLSKSAKRKKFLRQSDKNRNPRPVQPSNDSKL